MAITIADKYYFKAVEGYPYELEESMESLQYALSYDEEHVGALYLMACFYKEQLNDYAKAEEYFLQAIAADPSNGNVCIGYAYLLLQLKEYQKTKKMIDYLHKLRGIDKVVIFALEAIYFESQKLYDKALLKIREAKLESFDQQVTDELEAMKKRVEEKQKLNTPYFFEA